MNGMSLENIISIVGGLMVMGSVAVGAWIGINELRVRAIRRGRYAAAGGAPAPRATTVRPAGGVVGEQVLSSLKRLGQQSAVRDPGKLSVLRARLMQAGFYNREAPVIY